MPSSRARLGCCLPRRILGPLTMQPRGAPDSREMPGRAHDLAGPHTEPCHEFTEGCVSLSHGGKLHLIWGKGQPENRVTVAGSRRDVGVAGGPLRPPARFSWRSLFRGQSLLACPSVAAGLGGSPKNAWPGSNWVFLVEIDEGAGGIFCPRKTPVLPTPLRPISIAPRRGPLGGSVAPLRPCMLVLSDSADVVP